MGKDKKEFNYRFVIYKSNGKRIKLGGNYCHEVKSIAGAVFHLPNVQAVCVADKTGMVFLYLVKGEPEKTVNVPSCNAIFG